MKRFHLSVVTPDGKKYDGPAQSLTVRTIEGDVQILADHIDYFGAVAVGPCRIADANGNLRRASCAGGFLSVRQNEVRLVPTTFEYADEIDLLRARAAKERATASLQNAKSEKELRLAEAKLSRALNRISVAEKQ